MRLRTIAGQQVWDGRRRAVGVRFVPGIRHFQTGVRAYREVADCGDGEAVARLTEIDAGLAGIEQSLARWRRGIALFVVASLDESSVQAEQEGWREGTRLLRIRGPEIRRLAELIAQYDIACAETVAATRFARRRSIRNPHQESIRDRARTMRRVMALGYLGVRLRRRRSV